MTPNVVGNWRPREASGAKLRRCSGVPLTAALDEAATRRKPGCFGRIEVKMVPRPSSGGC